MNSAVCVLIGLVLQTVVNAGPERRSVGKPDKCPSCDKRYFKHYYVKKCTPVYEGGCDCPIRFDCPEYHRRMDVCLDTIAGKTYQIDEDMDVGDPCRKFKCSFSPVYGAVITRYQIDCPKENLPAGCYKRFTLGGCCRIEISCEDDDAMCFLDGKLYKKGQWMTPKSDLCTSCICDENWVGDITNSTNCITKTCALDEYWNNMEMGCIPIYVSVWCCPIQFYCESGHEELLPAETNEMVTDPNMQCVFGKVHVIRGNVGDGMDLHTYNKNIKCTCVTPPEFTCVE